MVLPRGSWCEEAGESLGKDLSRIARGQREARGIARFRLFLFRTAIPSSPASLLFFFFLPSLLRS